MHVRWTIGVLTCVFVGMLAVRTPASAQFHFEVTAHLDGFQDQKAEIDAGSAQTVEATLELGLAAISENITCAMSCDQREFRAVGSIAV